MSEQNLQPEPPYTQGEFDESQFDEEALHARRRQYGRFAASIAILAVAILAIPFSDHVKASGRVAPQRWAQVRSEVPGVVHEATHTNGDVVGEGAVIAVLDFDEQRDAVEAARLALPRERQKLLREFGGPVGRRLGCLQQAQDPRARQRAVIFNRSASLAFHLS